VRVKIDGGGVMDEVVRIRESIAESKMVIASSRVLVANTKRMIEASKQSILGLKQARRRSRNFFVLNRRSSEPRKV